MTTSEFSNEFDVLYNNITSNQAPGLNEYEKSVFLTKAQSQLVNEYFNNRIDGFGGGFDGSQKRQYDFSSLIKTCNLAISSMGTSDIPVDNRSKKVLFPTDYFLSVNEVVAETNSTKVTQYSVIPIEYDEYSRLMLKPYAFPVKKAVWRLFNSTTTDSTKQIMAEIIGKFKTGSTLNYKLRYISKPTPIILENISDYDVSIEGLDTITECSLPIETHQEILERAVTLAKIAWQGNTISQVRKDSE